MIFTEDAGVWKPLRPFADDEGVFRPVERGWELGADGVWREFYFSKVLTTVTLTGSTWVCPPEVRELVSVEGKGGNGGPAYTTPFTVAVAEVPSTFPPADRSGVDLHADGEYYNVSSSTHTDFIGTLGWGTYYARIIDGGWKLVREWYTEPSIYRPGALTKIGSGWSNPWPGGTRYYNVGGFFKYHPARTGGTTRGFGFSFPGGVQVPATPQRYYGTPVTPGQTYSYTLAPGGYLKITYYIYI